MLDLLASLSRRRWPYVLVGVLVVAVVVGPTLVDDDEQAADPASPDTTESVFVGTDSPTSSIQPASTAVGGSTTTLAEVDREGDEANPGSIFPGRPDTRENDQERLLGLEQAPARLSGFSTWVATATVERRGPDGLSGPFIKVTIRLVNRDDARQEATDDQWNLLRPDGVAVTTAYASPALVSGTDMAANGELFAELWYAAPVDGRYWLQFRPDAGSARGVWGLDVTLPTA